MQEFLGWHPGESSAPSPGRRAPGDGSDGSAPEPLSRLTTEFGWYHARTAEVVEAYEDDHRVIGACTGDAKPSLLDWVVGQLDAHTGQVVVDLGAGLGGPTRWISHRVPAEVIAVDALADSVAGLRRLFPSQPAAVARAGQLPFRDASIDRVVAIGVLDQVSSLARTAASIARVLRPGGRLVAVFHVSDLPVAGAPDANRFRTAGALLAPFSEAGFDEVALTSFSDLPDTPDLWRRVRATVEHAVAERNGDDPRHAAAVEDKRRFAALEEAGIISVRGMVAHRHA